MARRVSTGAALTGVVAGAGTAVLATKAGRFGVRKFSHLTDLNTLPGARQASAEAQATQGAGEPGAAPTPAPSFRNDGTPGQRHASRSTRAINASAAARPLSPWRMGGAASSHRDAVTDHFETPPDGRGNGQP